MARIFTEGFEMGDLGILMADSAWAVNNTYKRTGNYSLKRNSSGGPTNFRLELSASKTEIYLRCGVYSTEFSSLSYLIIYFRNGTNEVASLRANDVDLIRGYINGGLVSSAPVFLLNQWNLIECHLKIDVSGKFEYRLNGIDKFLYSGATNGGGSSIDNIVFSIRETHVTIDDIAINDTTGLEDNSWCGDGHIIAIKPNGNGDSSQLNGSDEDSVDNYLLVDEIPSDGDTTYVWGETVDNQDLYNLEAPSLPVNHKIKRVYAEARAKDSDAGNIALPIKAGTTQDDGTTKGLTTEYSAIKGDEYTVNPDTGLPWTESDLNALQAGVKIKS